MKQDLNLLPSVAKFQAAKVKLKKKIIFFSTIFLAIWVFLLVVVFVWLGINNILLTRAKKNNTMVLDQYKSLVTNVVLSKKNKHQAKIVGSVLSKRFEYGASIEKIINLFSGAIILEDFKIADKKHFVLNGKVNDGSEFIQVEEMIRDINLGLMPDFKSAKLSNISIKDNVWIFEMGVDLI